MQLVAGRGERHAEALALDVAGKQLANLRIVVGDENALRRIHQKLLLTPGHGCNEANFVTKPGPSCSPQCSDTKPMAQETLGNIATKGGQDRGLASHLSTLRCNMTYLPKFARVIAFAGVHMLTPAWGQTHDAQMGRRPWP